MLAGLKEKFNKLSPTAKMGTIAFVLVLVGSGGFMGYRTYQKRGFTVTTVPDTPDADADSDSDVAAPIAVNNSSPATNVFQPKIHKPTGGPSHDHTAQ